MTKSQAKLVDLVCLQKNLHGQSVKVGDGVMTRYEIGPDGTMEDVRADHAAKLLQSTFYVEKDTKRKPPAAKDDRPKVTGLITAQNEIIPTPAAAPALPPVEPTPQAEPLAPPVLPEPATVPVEAIYPAQPVGEEVWPDPKPDMTMDYLKTMGVDYGIAYKVGMSKDDLIKAIEAEMFKDAGAEPAKE